jgi:hypothetical protein
MTMRFVFEVGDPERSLIEFRRDPVFGKMTITANGRVVGGFRRNTYRVFVDGRLVEEHFGL